MRELNIEFQEQYKRLDKLCKEMYDSREGVSAYIQDMEQTSYYEQKAVYNWDVVYRQLKHMRWMRNQLAHEIDIDTYFCEQSDIDWIKQFYESIMNGTDPLTCAYKSTHQDVHYQTTPTIEPHNDIVVEEKQPKSLWSRIVSKIKSWFS